MADFLIDDCLSANDLPLSVRELKLLRLETPGPMLDAGYELLTRAFDPAVVDSKDTYEELLSKDGLRLDGFPLICMAAYFARGRDRLLAGHLAGNLMWIDREKRLLQLAIGNIATSPALLQRNVRGVGTALWQAAIATAKEEAIKPSGRLAYSVAEAEADSLGFWRKRGYLQPAGVCYLQPPLEFDEHGERIHDEVPETFLIRPLGNSNVQSIDAGTLRQMVLAIYRNWCLETNRGTLSPAALKTAEAYVMKRVFPKVDTTIAKTGEIPLLVP
jgi:hypothetical protein